MPSSLLIFLRINLPQGVKSTAKFGGLATIWRACAPWLQRGTDTIFDSGKARRAVPPREPEATPACAIVRMRSGNERRQL